MLLAFLTMQVQVLLTIYHIAQLNFLVVNTLIREVLAVLLIMQYLEHILDQYNNSNKRLERLEELVVLEV
jgi:hypothetical protein